MGANLIITPKSLW